MSANMLVNEILGQTATATQVLTVYLDINQAEQANLNRGFETALKNLLRTEAERLEGAERSGFDKAAEVAREAAGQIKPEGKGLLLIASEEGVLHQRFLQVPTQNQAKWGTRAHMRPLIEQEDEYQAALVLLVDRARARIFEIKGGAIEELEDANAEHDVRQIKQPGTDHMMSENRIQKMANEHASMHLRNVAQIVEKRVQENGIERLIVSGPAQPASELQSHLSERIRQNIVGTPSIAVTAKAGEVLAEAEQFLLNAERNREKDLVDRLITEAAKEGQACRGWRHTVMNALQQKIQILVYSTPPETRDEDLEQVAKLLQDSGFDESIDTADDLLEWLVEKAVQQSAAVERVDGHAATRLRSECHGVGAVLRY